LVVVVAAEGEAEVVRGYHEEGQQGSRAEVGVIALVAQGGRVVAGADGNQSKGRKASLHVVVLDRQLGPPLVVD